MENNFISAAQARLNFCPELYSKVMIDINQAIMDSSRTERSVSVPCPTKDNTHLRVKEQLKDHGFEVITHRQDSDIFTLEISW
jgi:hypothetical protein